MNNNINLLSFRLAFMVAAITLMMGLAWSVVGTPAQARTGLPDRNTPTPTNDDDDDDGQAGPVGAYIELHLNGGLANGWAVVQWQAPDSGGWHEVEGWRGPLPGNTQWWVHPKDFGTGPFRWAIYDGPGGKLLGASEPFNLPSGANQVIKVEVEQ